MLSTKVLAYHVISRWSPHCIKQPKRKDNDSQEGAIDFEVSERSTLFGGDLHILHYISYMTCDIRNISLICCLNSPCWCLSHPWWDWFLSKSHVLHIFLQIMSTTTHPMSTPCMEYLPTLARTKSSSFVGKYTIISPLFPIIWSIWHMGHITIMGMTTTDRRWRLSRWSGTCSPLCWASSAGRISGCWVGPVSSRCGCWYGMVNQGWWCVMWV